MTIYRKGISFFQLSILKNIATAITSTMRSPAITPNALANAFGFLSIRFLFLRFRFYPPVQISITRLKGFDVFSRIEEKLFLFYQIIRMHVEDFLCVR